MARPSAHRCVACTESLETSWTEAHATCTTRVRWVRNLGKLFFAKLFYQVKRTFSSKIETSRGISYHSNTQRAKAYKQAYNLYRTYFYFCACKIRYAPVAPSLCSKLATSYYQKHYILSRAELIIRGPHTNIRRSLTAPSCGTLVMSYTDAPYPFAFA